jgi:signal transduction histidine kinase/DNA-binding NarL/FixJ family response regulator
VFAEQPQPEAPPPALLEALRSAVATRASKGALLYPLVALILVRATEIWNEYRREAWIAAGVLTVSALARLGVTRYARTHPTDRAYLALIVSVTLQGCLWSCFVAAVYLRYGLVEATWLGLVSSSAFAAGATSAMGVDTRVHWPFALATAAPIIVAALARGDSTGLTIVATTLLYGAYLLRDARQNADAFQALMLAQHELTSARDRAREADQAKSAFLAMMSHEIRTPMHAAVGTASMLLETNLDERQRRYAETIVNAGEALVDLINDVLDMSRMDAQGTQLEVKDFELRAALAEVAQMFEPLARRSALEFRRVLDESTKIGVCGDKRRLQQILVNLVGNAIKFTERGSVTLEARARPYRGRFEITLVVADTGIGIEPDQLERVFQPFEQADSGIARKYGGTGLGLAISKRLAEAMSGEIEVTSARGRGTTFTVTLQLPAAIRTREALDDEERLRSLLADSEVPAGTRVLVVDDSALNREMAKEMLERLRCAVETVSSGAEALAMCRTRMFDIILMDCQMRDLDGYATTRAIRTLENENSRAPIVAVTANAFEDDRKRALESGMNDVLSKPFGIRELHRALSRWVSTIGDLPEELQGGGSRLPNESLYPQAIKHIQSMLDGSLDSRAIDRVVDAFLLQWPQRRAALELALDAGDSLSLREVIHALEGAIPYFGIERLNETLRRFQQYARAGEIDAAKSVFPELATLIEELAASRERHKGLKSA